MKKVLFLVFLFFPLVYAFGQKGTVATPKSTEVAKNTVVNIYIDNTGSMFGYMGASGDLDAYLSGLVTNLFINDFALDTDIHLHFINSAIFPYTGNASSLIRDLSKHNAKTFKGDLGRTQVSGFFDQVLAKSGKDTVSIIISDFIISPGSGDNAINVVSSEKNSISHAFKVAKNKNPNICVAVFRLKSEFNGNYYDCNDKYKVLSHVKRPLYMFVIGNKSDVIKFNGKVKPASITNNNGEKLVKNSYTVFSMPQKTAKLQVVYVNQGSVTSSTSVKKAHLKDGVFRITVAVDLSKFSLLGPSYLNNIKNYRITSGYEVKKIMPFKSYGYTHKLIIESKKPISPTELSISLKNKLPDWIRKYSLQSKDWKQVFEDKNISSKTFGIQEVIESISSVYYPNSSDFVTFSVQINK